MAQTLSILALSTKAMTEWRISKSIHGRCYFLADYGPEKFLKKLMGRTDVEDALLRLDFLTKEEGLMAVAKNLEVTHHVDRNVEEVKVLVEGTDDRVQVIERATQDVDQSVKAVERRTQRFLFTHVPTLIPIASQYRNGRATAFVTPR